MPDKQRLTNLLKEKPVYTGSKRLFKLKKLFGLKDAYDIRISGFPSGTEDIFDRTEWQGPNGTISAPIQTREELEYNYKNCGAGGELQISTQGETRLTVYTCNQRHFCPRCAQRYAYGKSRNLKTIIKGILRSKHPSYLAPIVFSIPKELSETFHHYLTRDEKKEILNELQHAARAVVTEVFAPNKNDSRIAGATVSHTWSSKRPWEPHWHIHALLPSVYLANYSSKPVKKSLPRSGFVAQEVLDELRARWREEVDKRLQDHYPPDFNLPDELDVKYRFVKYKPGYERSENQISHKVTYALRSHMIDLWDALYQTLHPYDFLNRDEDDYFPLDRVSEIADIYEEFKIKGVDEDTLETVRYENIRYFGYWAKSIRKKKLTAHFGLKLSDEDDFEVAYSEPFSIIQRNKDWLRIKFHNFAGRVFKVKRWAFSGENAYLSGQVWMDSSSSARSPPEEISEIMSEIRVNPEEAIKAKETVGGVL